MKTKEQKAAIANKKKRAIGTTSINPEVPVEVQRLAVEHYAANKEANANKGKANKARTALFKSMKEHGINSCEVETNLDGSPLLLSCDIKTPQRQVIDIEKLAKVVDKETFMLIVTAAVSTVEQIAGKETLMQCSETTEGNTNVTVKAKG